MSKVMLSTSDNPWNPIKNFDAWYAWDTAQGYNTAEYLARIAPVSINLPDETNDRIINDAIGEIVAKDLLGLVTDNKIHYIAVRNSEETPTP